MTNKFRDEEINISRDTVCRKFKQIGNVSKIPVEDHELSLQQKKVRLKWCKNIRIKRLRQRIFYRRKTFKTGNKKKKDGWKKKKKIIKLMLIFKNKYIRTIKKV